MSFDIIYKHFARTVFVMAFIGITVAFLELAGDIFNISITGGRYTAGRLLELSAALLVFVIAVLLRQIRDELRASRGS